MNTTSPPELPADGHLLDTLDYLSEPKAAIALGIGTQTLIGYRKAGRGPPFTAIGRQFFYARAKLQQWLEAGGTLQAEAGRANATKAKPAAKRRTAAEARAR